jgi:glucose/arabinose dehydrogenase
MRALASIALVGAALGLASCIESPAAPAPTTPTLNVMSVGLLPTAVTTAGLRYRVLATQDSGEVPLSITATRDTIQGGYPFPAGLLEVQVVARDAASAIVLQSFRDTVVVQPAATTSFVAVLLCVSPACEGSNGEGTVGATALIPTAESEPNNFVTSADSIGLRTLSGVGRVAAASGRLATSLDVDVYRVDLPASASALTYDVQLYAQRVDPNATLLSTLEQVESSPTDPNGTTLQSVTSCASAVTSDTCLRFTVPASASPTRAFLRVRGRSGTSGRYTVVLQEAALAATDAPVLTRSVVMSGLFSPWDVAFAPNGAMFFTERCVGLSVRQPSGTIVHLFGLAGASLVAPDFFCTGQSGMLGVALDPAFATNRRVYVFMASNLSTAPRTNRVVRLELNPSFTAASNRTDIITDIPFKNVGTPNGAEGAHSGGRIRFGPDGFLYVTTGDNHNGSLPQDPTRLGGKVVRVTTDGAAAPGNNPPNGFDPRIYAYGFRNVQGISFQPSTGRVFIAEHGPSYSDEVTRLDPGVNGGWDPQNRPGLTCPDSYCGYAGSPTTMPMTDLTRFPTARAPAWNNNSTSQGMGPATFLIGSNWRGWEGRLAVGIMGGQRLVLLTLDANGNVTADENVALPAARYRSLVQSPDGALFVVTDAGEIWRVVPSPAP